ncbi:hypothetical protein OESDEN_15390 [Oesophagostomum dentatum]|uniref:Uncharacterized protein n=1 Tax=Oesophagostomum dentatum TaxID=61180 RepID=A0A0B1SNV1_OESDE|nr:hypothetical protein OESDEN_15390 [Oesophagostomum dentatum]
MSYLVSFGFGAGSNGSASGAAVGFGFGTNAAKEPTAVKDGSSGISFGTTSQDTKTTTASETTSSLQPKKDVQPPLVKTASSPAFGIAPPNSEDPKPQSTFTLGAGSALFGAGAKPPLFGSSSTSLFNTSSSTGSLLTSAAVQPSAAPAPVSTASQAAPTSAPTPFTFGATPAASFSKPFGAPEAKKEEVAPPASTVPAFGSGLPFGSLSSNPQAQVSVANTAALSLATTTSTTAGSTLSSGIFGMQTNKPSFPTFGSSADAPKPLFGSSSSIAADAPKAPLFGASQPPAEAPKPLFGASAPAPANKPIFGTTAAPPAPATNGGPSFNFGSSK